MADEPQPETKGPGAEGASAVGTTFPPFVLSGQYIRDFSFEVPKAPQIFALLQEHQPDIKINVDVQVQAMNETLFEVVLRTEATCKAGETVAFVMEIAYGGLVTVNVPREKLHYTLLVEAPKLLFPFVRYLMTDITREGGFPPLMMGLVDFDAMYQGQLKRQQEGGTATG